MPTGYTSQITDEMPFNEFAMICARGMGALIMMRDEPFDAPIPERFEPSNYHSVKQVEAEAAIAKLTSLSVEEAENEAQRVYGQEEEQHRQTIEKKNTARSRYERMLAKVQSWTPPTPDHEEFKRFMIDQITGSIDFDCDNSYYIKNAPKRLSGEQWKEEAINKARKDFSYHGKQHREEIERTEERNKWLKALRESLS
jgi:hypothetical protein